MRGYRIESLIHIGHLIEPAQHDRSALAWRVVEFNVNLLGKLSNTLLVTLASSDRAQASGVGPSLLGSVPHAGLLDTKQYKRLALQRVYKLTAVPPGVMQSWN